jgi:beta-mannosidase
VGCQWQDRRPCRDCGVEVRFHRYRQRDQTLCLEDVKIVANGTTEIFKGTIDNTKEEAHVLAARIWVDGKIVSRDTDWPQPLKYLDFSDRGVEVTPQGNEIKIKAARPTKGLVFEERQRILVDDSAIDVVPGDEQTVRVKGLGKNDEALKWMYLGKP